MGFNEGPVTWTIDRASFADRIRLHRLLSRSFSPSVVMPSFPRGKISLSLSQVLFSRPSDEPVMLFSSLRSRRKRPRLNTRLSVFLMQCTVFFQVYPDRLHFLFRLTGITIDTVILKLSHSLCHCREFDSRTIDNAGAARISTFSFSCE